MTDTISKERVIENAQNIYDMFVSNYGFSSVLALDMKAVLDSLRAALAQQAEQATCEWKQDPDYEMGDTYHSSCGELWSFIDGGPKENRVSYCHHCGKPVKLAAPKGGV